MTLADAYQNFIYYKKLQGVSPNTLTAYYFHIKKFLDYIGSDTPIESVTESWVNNYIMFLHGCGLSRNSVCTYIRNLRIILTYIYNEWGLSFSPSKIRIPKAPQKMAYIYSDDDIREIFQAADSSSSVPWISARNKALIALMLDSGLRQGEVATLRTSNVFFEKKQLKVHGKGDKERFVPLGTLSMHLLQAYMDLCPFHNTPWVFCSDDGSELSCGAIRTFMHRLAKSFHFPFFSHNLRHNYATNYCLYYLRKGQQADAYTLQQLMGHSSLVTTERYLHLASSIFASESSVSHLDAIFGLS